MHLTADESVERSLQSTIDQESADTGPEKPAVDSPSPPTGRYTVVRPHAKGGLGEVLIAQDTELNRPIALKRIQARHAHDAASKRRFLVEAEITARLEHPGIVPVYGLVTDADGQPTYAMRFIEGDSLADAIKRFHHSDDSKPAGADFESLEFRQLLQRFIAVCNTIAYAHSRGIIHRDIKPANVMLGKFGETLGRRLGTGQADLRPDRSITKHRRSRTLPRTPTMTRSERRSAKRSARRRT